jgi:L-ascorbate metabolism protein UlaG (beta-lactamase superfamily)
MGIDDAIKAAEFVRCPEILGLHYNTFPPIRIDAPAAFEKFKAAHQRLHLLAPGESHNF